MFDESININKITKFNNHEKKERKNACSRVHMAWYVPRGGPGSTARRKRTTHMSKKRCLRLTQRTQGALLKPCQAVNKQCRSPQCQSHSTSRAHNAGSLTPHSTTLVALRVLQVPNPTCKIPSQNMDARQLKLDLKTRKMGERLARNPLG